VIQPPGSTANEWEHCRRQPFSSPMRRLAAGLQVSWLTSLRARAGGACSPITYTSVQGVGARGDMGDALLPLLTFSVD